jgi:hypothetical protein
VVICDNYEWMDVMSTHASVLVDSVGPPSAEVCRAVLLVDGRGSRQSLCVVNNQPVGNPKRKV